MPETVPPETEPQSNPIDPTHPTDGFLVDDILPANCVHLLGGASGVGKTTFALQFLDEWHASRTFLGLPAAPVPFCWVSCKRSNKSLCRTIRRVRPSIVVPIVSLIGSIPVREGDSPVHHALKLARDRVPELRLLVFDSLTALCPGKITDNAAVAKFMSSLNSLCERESVTILGFGQAAKIREGETIHNPRERFIGSVAWGGFAETVIHIESLKVSDPKDKRRQVTILPMNSSPITLNYELDAAGCYQDAGEDIASSMLDGWADELPTGAEFSTSEALSAMMARGISRRSIFRWLKASTRLLKISHGRYRVLPKAQSADPS